MCGYHVTYCGYHCAYCGYHCAYCGYHDTYRGYHVTYSETTLRTGQNLLGTYDLGRVLGKICLEKGLRPPFLS